MLALTTADRFDALPDIPPLQEAVPGFELTTWFGLGAPRNTPAEVIEKLNREVAVGPRRPQEKRTTDCPWRGGAWGGRLPTLPS